MNNPSVSLSLQMSKQVSSILPSDLRLRQLQFDESALLAERFPKIVSRFCKSFQILRATWTPGLRMSQIGMALEAGRISFLIHKLSWTTGAELVRELESAFRGVMSSSNVLKMPQVLKDEIVACIVMLADLPEV